VANNDNGNFSWLGFLVVAVCVMSLISAMFGNNNSSSSTSSYTPATNHDSFEHRYATERFKQEGYSARESQQAADAVVKFLQAQEARKR
jgi:ribosomal protein S24E